jgi:hypothetical protein
VEQIEVSVRWLGVAFVWSLSHSDAVGIQQMCRDAADCYIFRHRNSMGDLSALWNGFSVGADEVTEN